MPDAVHAAIPDFFREVALVILRYRNVTAKVTAVEFAAGASTHEFKVRTKVQITAERQRPKVEVRDFKLQSTWIDDGTADVAVVDIDGRLSLATAGPATIKVRALLDQVRVDVQLDAFKSVSLPATFGGREVASRPFDLVPSAHVPTGTTISRFDILLVQGKVARVRIILMLPPEGDAGAADAGNADVGAPG